jgi:hypothetical protein
MSRHAQMHAASAAERNQVSCHPRYEGEHSLVNLSNGRSWQRCHAETTVHRMTRGAADATQLHAASLSSQPPWPTDIKGGGVGMASSTADRK